MGTIQTQMLIIVPNAGALCQRYSFFPFEVCGQTRFPVSLSGHEKKIFAAGKAPAAFAPQFAVQSCDFQPDLP
jgi:hypothetical protein